MPDLTQEEIDALIDEKSPMPAAGFDTLPMKSSEAQPEPESPTADTSSVSPDDDTDTDKDLDSYIDQQASQPVPQPEEQTRAPEQSAPPAPAAKAPVIASTTGTESKLVRKAPDWYDYVAPPKGLGPGRAMPAIFGSLMSVLADKKHDPQKFLNSFIPAVGQATDSPQADYDHRLDSAKKQADMTATLHSGAGNALGAANLDLQWQKYLHVLEKEKGKAEADRQLKDPNSEISKQIRDAYVTGGIFKPEDAAKLSGWQLQQGRVGAQQLAGSQRQFEGQKKMGNIRYDQWIEKFRMANNEHDRRQALEELQKISGEEREQGRKDEAAQIPGLKFIGKHAPSPAAVDEARNIQSAKIIIKQNAERLAELQKKVSDPLSQATNGWAQLFPSGENQQDVLDEMRDLQQELAAQQRVIWHQGVPQKYEIEGNEKTNPNTNSVFTFFRGYNQWKTMAKAAERTGNMRLRTNQFEPDADGASESGIEDPKSSAPAPKHSAGEMIKRGGEMLGEGAHKAAEVVGAPAAALKVQVMDPVTKQWGAARDVTVDQYRQAMKALAAKGLGPAYIRKAQ